VAFLERKGGEAMKGSLKAFYSPREFYQEHRHVTNGFVVFLLFVILMVNSRMARNYVKAVPADEILMLVVSALLSGLVTLFLLSFIVKQTSKMLGGEGKAAKEHRMAYLWSNIPQVIGLLIMGVGSIFLGMKLFYPDKEKYWNLMTNGEAVAVDICWYLYGAFNIWAFVNWVINISELERIRKWHAFIAVFCAIIVLAVVITPLLLILSLGM